MKLIKVFDDDDLNPRSGWACLKGDQLILKDDFMGFPAGSRLIVGSDHAVKMRDTFQLNELLKAEHRQFKNLKGSYKNEFNTIKHCKRY